jgi:hypothetical protein
MPYCDELGKQASRKAADRKIGFLKVPFSAIGLNLMKPNRANRLNQLPPLHSSYALRSIHFRRNGAFSTFILPTTTAHPYPHSDVDFAEAGGLQEA